MITFCFLAAQGGCEPQLTSHAAANMRIGNDKEFLIKIISQCLPYIGYPRSLNALRCVNEAAKGKETKMEEKEVIRECYRKMYQGMIEKDRNLLSDVLADSFVLVHMTGMRQDKEEFIKAIENGTLNYYSAGHQEIRVEVRNRKAELIGKSMVNATVFGGGRHTWRLQLKISLSQIKDGWQMTEGSGGYYADI